MELFCNPFLHKKALHNGKGALFGSSLKLLIKQFPTLFRPLLQAEQERTLLLPPCRACWPDAL